MFSSRQVVSTMIALCLSSPAWADVRTRYGAVLKSDAAVVGGLTATYQASDDHRLHDELLMSLDLVAHQKLGNGQLNIYAEASTTPQYNGIAAVLTEANADAGSATDRDNRGRIQISELHYSCTYTQRCFSVGLIDPAAFLDASEVANDETSQFLNTTLVNNPTIAFPDYTLGVVFHQDHAAGIPGYTLFVSSSHGLADNPDKSYSQLVDIGAAGKGAFIAAEVYWQNETSTRRIGIWNSTADHPSLDGSSSTESNYGAYVLLDLLLDNNRINLRGGVANDEVSEAAGFVALAAEHSYSKYTIGAGISRTWLADAARSPNRDDQSSAELYARYAVADNFSVSPSIQWLQNSGFDASEINYAREVVVYSLRGSYTF